MTPKKRLSVTLDERSLALLKGQARLLSGKSKRKVTVGEVISSLVLNAKPDIWTAVREELGSTE
jgi:hypothetical protein